MELTYPLVEPLNNSRLDAPLQPLVLVRAFNPWAARVSDVGVTLATCTYQTLRIASTAAASSISTSSCDRTDICNHR